MFCRAARWGITEKDLVGIEEFIVALTKELCARGAVRARHVVDIMYRCLFVSTELETSACSDCGCCVFDYTCNSQYTQKFGEGKLARLVHDDSAQG